VASALVGDVPDVVWVEAFRTAPLLVDSILTHDRVVSAGQRLIKFHGPVQIRDHRRDPPLPIVKTGWIVET
jgi:hypothetical protein